MALATVDFFLTANPYEANHGFSSYIVNVGRIFLLIFLYFSVEYIINHGGKIPKSIYILFLPMTFIAVSIFNGDLFQYPHKVMADSFRFLFVSLFAIDRASNSRKKLDLRKIWMVLCALTIIGMILVLFGNGRYGYYPKFLILDRAHRGEVAYWETIGQADVLAAVSLVLYEKQKKILYIFPAVLFAMFYFFSWHRSAFVIAATPFILFFLFRDNKKSRKFFLTLCAIPLLPILVRTIYRFIFVEQSQFGGITSGRMDLWKFYINGFKDHILFGTGYNYNLGFSGAAQVEISLLRWLTEHGIIVGGTIALYMFIAAIKAFNYFRDRNNKDEVSLVLSYIFLMQFPESIFESNGVIGTIGSFLYWYAMFYFLFHKEPVLKGYRFVCCRGIRKSENFSSCRVGFNK